MESDDPTVIRSLAVTADDVVAALEANARRDAGAVLRVTPPFSGRMRARLHLAGAESEYDSPAPLHISPEQFLETVPPFPTPDETEDALRSDDETEYTSERHRRRHEATVEEWREAIKEKFTDGFSLRLSGDEHEISVSILG